MFVGNKDTIIAVFEKAGHPLDEIHIRTLHEVARELKAIGVSQDFAMIDIKCRVCSHKTNTVVPLVADLENLECANCGNKTCQEDVEDADYETDEADEKEFWQE